MAQRFYLAGHESQRDTGPLAGFNCAAASGAMLADQGTLGIKDPSVRWFRYLTGDREGGLQMSAVATVLERMGVEVRLYDHEDNLKWDRLKSFLARGWFAVVAGDYDIVKGDLRGADYDGFHAVVYHQRFKENQRVGDPLQDGWLKWPNELAYRYVAKFDRQTTGGIHAVIMVPDRALPRSEIVEANVRAAPTRSSSTIATLRRGQSLVTGGTVKGEEIAGVDLWRKVWVPSASSIGYIHWTAAWKK